jgi:hypothetical protein
MSFDLVLRGGTLHDGSEQPGIRGDLAIAEGRIAAMGDAAVLERLFWSTACRWLKTPPIPARFPERSSSALPAVMFPER